MSSACCRTVLPRSHLVPKIIPIDRVHVWIVCVATRAQLHQRQADDHSDLRSLVPRSEYLGLRYCSIGSHEDTCMYLSMELRFSARKTMEGDLE